MSRVTVGRSDGLDLLLVTDDRNDAAHLVDSFETTSVNTTLHTVRTDEAGLEALEHDEDVPPSAPDIVLVDLPQRDALAFLEALESERRFAHVPVLVVDDGSDDVTRYYERGVNACLERSDEFDDLVSAIETFWCDRVQLPPK